MAALAWPRIKRPNDVKRLTAFEKQHVPRLLMYEAAEDGARVPVTVIVQHPMNPGHFIRSIEILNYQDPIISKGIFYFSPANGEAYLSTQVRLDSGQTTVYAVAECTQHGKWAGSAEIFVNRGGC